MTQRRERQLRLGLDAGDLRDAKVGCTLRCVSQQRGLPDPGLAAHDERSALAAASVRDDLVERYAFARPPTQLRGLRGSANDSVHEENLDQSASPRKACTSAANRS
jgi:hypothetical protein